MIYNYWIRPNCSPKSSESSNSRSYANNQMLSSSINHQVFVRSKIHKPVWINSSVTAITTPNIRTPAMQTNKPTAYNCKSISHKKIKQSYARLVDKPILSRPTNLDSTQYLINQSCPRRHYIRFFPISICSLAMKCNRQTHVEFYVKLLKQKYIQIFTTTKKTKWTVSHYSPRTKRQ